LLKDTEKDVAGYKPAPPARKRPNNRVNANGGLAPPATQEAFTASSTPSPNSSKLAVSIPRPRDVVPFAGGCAGSKVVARGCVTSPKANGPSSTALLPSSPSGNVGLKAPGTGPVVKTAKLQDLYIPRPPGVARKIFRVPRHIAQDPELFEKYKVKQR
jgi:hypothetical protein